MAVGMASEALPNQVTFSVAKPDRRKAAFSNPYWALKIHCQVTAVTTKEIVQGIRRGYVRSDAP